VSVADTDIASRRLHNQQIAGTPFARPEEVVRWLGAVQAQDYGGAKWAVGLRSAGVTDAAMDRALADGVILRTHVLRPTWHFVTPADIRWMLALTAPRVNALNAYYYRTLGLDHTVFRRSNAALARALQGGRQLTRPELVAALKQAGIAAETLLGYTLLLMRAELDAVICSGALRGKQHTYALLDERASQARTLEREEALAELAGRYFASHGPATLKDFVWWSGLTAADAKSGLELVKPHLMHEVIDGQTYWFAPSSPPVQRVSPTAYFLPNFDEYTVGYSDRSAVCGALHAKGLEARANVVLGYVIVLDGQIVGTWKRTLKKGAVAIETTPFVQLDEAEMQALHVAAERYGVFSKRPVQFSRRAGNTEVREATDHAAAADDDPPRLG